MGQSCDRIALTSRCSFFVIKGMEGDVVVLWRGDVVMAGYQKETAGSRFLVKYTPAVAVQ